MRNNLPKLFSLILSFLLLNANLFAQLNFTVNSLADDNSSHPYNDPNTPQDESKDGICNDELGRCTIRAAVEEAFLMNQSVKIKFSVSGFIELTDVINLHDGCEIDGENQIELTGFAPLELQNNCKLTGLRFNNAIVGVTVYGNNNQIGEFPGANEFTNCNVGLAIEGHFNNVFNNYFGINSLGDAQPNQTSIIITGDNNNIGNSEIGNSNIICASNTAGIIISEGIGNKISRNYIGTNQDGISGVGNSQGIIINGAGDNLIGGTEQEFNVISGNSVHGILIAGVPPDSYSPGNIITNNIIGLKPDQSNPLPNGWGINITAGVISTRIVNNVISGNSADGIYIFAYDSSSYTLGHVIEGNKIGISDQWNTFPNGLSGINIAGYVEKVKIGTDETNNFLPNTIVGNLGKGIDIKSEFGFSPKEITIRKNIIRQNQQGNLIVDTLSNNKIKPPANVGITGNTIYGTHAPGVLIDLYVADQFEATPSAYLWIGSAVTDASGIFTFDITDPNIRAVSLKATTFSGNSSTFEKILLNPSGIKDIDDIPKDFSLSQNYPNPFNPSTKIYFSLPEERNIVLKIFSISGEEKKILIDQNLSAGSYTVDFNAEELSSGIYFYNLTAGSFSSTKKMILLK